MPGRGGARPLLRSVESADRDLLTAKLVRPRVPPAHVPRPRLDELLTRGTAGPLTTVVAGAGWGKTLATAAWVTSGTAVGPVAWVSLDESDNEPRSFWSYVAAAVRRAIPVPPDNPLAQLSPGLGGGEENVRRLAAGFSDLGTPLVIVLDDFQHVQDPVLLSGLSELLHLKVASARFVLLSRSDPAMPLHRLRMSDDLVEVRATDLSFSVSEAQTMLRAHEAAVDVEDAGLLVRRTEGWPAGLRLAAFFLQGREPGTSASDFGGADRNVTGYLAEEVLAAQPPEVRRFLLRTSVPERLTGDLAEVLSEQPLGQRRLESLEVTNAFVVGLGPGREWFRYHSLLREMLLHRLEVEEPDLLRDLRRRTSQWYADAGYPVEALQHAADAPDWSLVGRILVGQALPLLVSADGAAVDQVLARIPTHRLGDEPELALCAAARMFHAKRFAEMAPHLERASMLLHTGTDTSSASRVALRLLSIVVSRSRGDVASLIDDAQAVLTALESPPPSVVAVEAMRTIALSNLGTGLFWSGRVAEAEEHLTRGLEVSVDIGLELARINMQSHLALVAAVSGRLGVARRHATHALEVVEDRGWAPLPQAATAYLALALADTETFHLSAARRWLAQGAASAVSEPAPRLALGLAMVRVSAAAGQHTVAREQLAQVARDLGGWQPPTYLARWLSLTEAELDLAEGAPDGAARRIATPAGTDPPFARERVCLARAALASGDPSRAEDALAPLVDVQDGTAAVEGWLVTALVADRRHEDDRALDALRKALELAEPEEVRRPFLVLGGGAVSRLLVRLRRLGTGPTGFVDLLLRDLGAGEPQGGGSPPSEPLTDRELSVLRLLPTMMTNAEIAAELFVSTNTVKAHLKHVFRKLDVATRREAVQRARELGLLTG